MHPDKKITKEDTWKSDDLRRHLKAGGPDEDFGRRGEEYERRYRAGEPVERRRRDPERDARKERANPREIDRTKPRDVERERPQDRRKDGSRDRTGIREEREKYSRKDKDRDKDTDNGKYRERDRDRLDKRRDREEKENREKIKERERKERTIEREKKAKETSEREKERERETDERVRERTSEKDRQRGKDSGEGRRRRDHDPERRARRTERENLKESEHIKDSSQEKRGDKERKERPMGRGQSEPTVNREYREQHRKEKDRETKFHSGHSSGESQRHKGESGEVERSHRERRRADGERERERDQHRERRHREGAGPERDRAEQTGTTKSSPSDLKLDKENTESGKTEVEIDDGTSEDRGYNEAQDYEEDFEDYEEDFEEVDESEEEDNKKIPSDEESNDREDIRSQRNKEVEAIRRAMDEENKRVGSAHLRLSTERTDTPRTSGDTETPPSKGLQQHGRFINFVAAKHREFSKMVASKQKKRSAELLRLIDLDVSVTFFLLDLPPVNEYDMYIKSFGTTNTKQAYVQCNEDNTNRDIQTEEIETSEKWTQHPADWNVVCGGPTSSLEVPDESGPKLNIDSQRLAKFLCSASQVVAVLLEEDRADMQSLKRLKTLADTLSFGDGCLPLNTNLPFLCGRPVNMVHFSQVQRQTMLSVHGPMAEPSAVPLDSKTVICVWNIWEPSRPHKVLVYESEVNCCCFSPGKSTLVFAGTSVGSVVLWDLREQASAHYTLRIGENDWTLRHPTFSSDAVFAASGHKSSVISVEAIPSTVAEGLRPDLSWFASDGESSGSSFQLASLDENGVLNIWVVLDLLKANSAGSQSDLGLRPGGRVKLLHSSTVLTMSERSSARDPKKTTPLHPLLLKLLPSDSNHFFIGTDMGVVNHGTSHGLKTTPKLYMPHVVGFRPVNVTSIDFSPFGEPIFLVGCGDGSVRLHTVLNEQPLMEWSSCTAGQPVVSVQWAQTRPAVFCVLDASSCLHIWDLLEKDFEPVVTEKLHADRVTAMAVFGDPAKQNTSGIALAMQSGKIEMQCFSKRFTVPESADLEKLKSMMLEAF